MLHRWRANRGVDVLLRWLLVYCFALPMPRLLVHSHASVVEHGAGTSALQQHIKLYHAGQLGQMDFFKLHCHWTFAPSHDQLPSNSPHDTGIVAANKMPADIGSDTELESPCLFLPPHCCPESEQSRCHIGLCAQKLFAGPERIQLGVWNC